MRFKVVPHRGEWKYVIQHLYVSARGEGLPMCGRHWLTTCVGFADEADEAYRICEAEHSQWMSAKEERSNIMRAADKVRQLVFG